MRRAARRRQSADVILTGILPTLTKSDLSLENITPRARYYALNEAMHHAGGGAFRLRIRGTDELMIEHDSVMLEVVQHQLPGAPPGLGGGVRAPLQRGTGGHRPRPGGVRQFATPLRQAALARDPDRALSSSRWTRAARTCTCAR